MRDVGPNEAFLRRTRRKRPNPGRRPTVTERVERAVDAMVGVVSPSAKIRRLVQRHAYSLAASSGAYVGAKRTRLNESWIAKDGSADSDLLPDLPTLRDRSRELFRNDGLARGIAKTLVDNVVGSGIRPHPNPDREFLDISDAQAEDFKGQALAAWDRWATSTEADSSGRLDFYRLQRLACYHRIIDGETISIPAMIDDRGRMFERACRVVDPVLLEDPYRGAERSSNMRAGIELGQRGEPLRYWFRRMHQSDAQFQGRPPGETHYSVAARVNGYPGVIHVYDQVRAGQSRGEPLFAPVLDDFHDLRSYLKAERVAAEIAACITYWITDSGGMADIQQLDHDKAGNPLADVYPGMVGNLNPGESIDQLAHDRPGTTFEPFVMRIIRQIGIGIGLSYDAVSRDTSQSNYSNTRTAVLSDRRTYRYEQQSSAIGFSDPYWRMVLYEAWLKRDLPAAGADFVVNMDRWLRVDWIGEGWDWVDPLKDIQAATQEVELGINSRTRLALQRGRSFKEIQREQTIEREIMGAPVDGDDDDVPVLPSGERDDDEQ